MSSCVAPFFFVRPREYTCFGALSQLYSNRYHPVMFTFKVPLNPRELGRHFPFSFLYSAYVTIIDRREKIKNRWKGRREAI